MLTLEKVVLMGVMLLWRSGGGHRIVKSVSVWINAGKVVRDIKAACCPSDRVSVLRLLDRHGLAVALSSTVLLV